MEVKPADHHSITIEKTGHYYTLGNLSDQTKYVWLVCHGYGQAADRFIQKFRKLDLSKHFIIAPEGLHRFYWGGTSGRVVASWMTSKDRLYEISEHTAFLQDVLLKYRKKHHGLILCGFSQGVATVTRYMERFKPSFDHLLLWAGSFPRDIDSIRWNEYVGRGKTHLYYGTQDELLIPELLAEEKKYFKDHGFSVMEHTFEGGHSVDSDLILEFARINLLDGNRQ